MQARPPAERRLLGGARLRGATPWVIITRVFLPLMWPALVTTGMP